MSNSAFIIFKDESDEDVILSLERLHKVEKCKDGRTMITLDPPDKDSPIEKIYTKVPVKELWQLIKEKT